MSNYVISFGDASKQTSVLTGGKGANLAELTRVTGIKVPDGFCITTAAYKETITTNQDFINLVDDLNRLSATDRKKIGELCSKIRGIIEHTPIPKPIADEIWQHFKTMDQESPAGSIGDHHNKLVRRPTYAIRSSATAEDLPTASFAGQHNTFLNIIGGEAILEHVSKCWASLFTERAVLYRMQNGFDHNSVLLSVIVQKMIFPVAAGIVFSADPLTGNRKIVSIDAGFGLGEAMVSGLVNADNYTVQEGRIIRKKIAEKKLAIHAVENGGTVEQIVDPALQKKQVLNKSQILQLEKLARTIEAHFGVPQDIEWCLADNSFYIVQSRPITTLYPVPPANDKDNHIYISVGHNQMMTDAMKPLGLSFFQLTTMAKTAGGRLYMDVTKQFAVTESRKKLIEVAGQNDRLLQDALRTLEKRKGFIKPSPDPAPAVVFIAKKLSWSYLATFENNPSIISDLVQLAESSVKDCKQQISTKSGTDVFDFILADIPRLKQLLFNPQSFEAMKIGWYASGWINKRILKWLGDKNIAGVLSQSAPDNITAEMGLALLDVADVIRPYPELTVFLQNDADDNFLEQIDRFKGGPEFKKVITTFLDKYGMRCAGEIDITKTRWIEKPSILLASILTNLKNFEHGEHQRKFEKGRQEAINKEQELMERLKQLPDGNRKARETKRMIGLLRKFVGYREYPKYSIINRYFVYKQALLKEAEVLKKANIIHSTDDVYYLHLEEFREAVRTRKVDYRIIDERKTQFNIFEKLQPPRVITSDGERITGKYKRDNIPANALVGLGVSSGIVEGRARVILSMEDADLQEDDILVTAFTDPSWTPLFVAIKGLVTEAGGLMTHGAVIAREYGLPAVVGLENACSLIRDGQRIRLNGDDGFVEII